MDERGLDFIKSLIAGHIDSALRGQPTSHSGRGASLFDLHNRVIKQAEKTVADVDAKLEAGDDDNVLRYAERTLRRTLAEVETVLPFLRPLMESVSRDDVPIGMLVALDSAIDALLPAGADPIVHLNDRHMYSTLDLYRLLRWPREKRRLAPVAFFVPVLSPFNALMTPLLVHEMGHSAIIQASLGSSAMSVASDDLNALLAEHLSNADPETRFKAQTQLVGWVDELLCDSLATALCGPSYLFAEAAFLPATAPDDPTSSHPFPSFRLHLSLASLESTGWGDLLQDICPETTEWLRRQATFPTPTSKQERFLREACDALAPAIMSTVSDHVREPIDADGYAAVAPHALDQMRIRVPASEIDQEPIEPWHIVALGWQWSFEIRGDSPATLAEAPSDTELSRVLLRAIEMAQIRRLWKDHDAV